MLPSAGTSRSANQVVLGRLQSCGSAVQFRGGGHLDTTPHASLRLSLRLNKDMNEESREFYHGYVDMVKTLSMEEAR